MRRVPSLLALSALPVTLALAACGGSDKAATTTPAPVETAAPTTTETPAATAAPVDTLQPAGTEAPTVSVAANTAAPSGAVTVSMVEWEIETPTEIAAGIVTFDVSNAGSFPHHFAIARGNSYEELPMAGGGAVDEEALGDDYLGRTANLQGGGTETIEFDLAPGNYVFFCNIAGTVSHAAQGQVLSVTVS